MNIQKLLYQNIVWRGLFYLLGFILNIAIARHFQSEFTGRLYYLINAYAFVTLIASVSMEAGITYFASSRIISPSRLLNFSILWVIVIAMLMIGVFLCSSFFTKLTISKNQFLFALFFVCGNITVTFLNSLFYAESKFILPNFIGIIVNIFLISLIFFINKNYWLTDEKYVFIYFASFLLQGIILIIIFTFRIHIKYQLHLPKIAEVKMLFKFCLLAFVSNFITFLYYRIDYWFVNHYRTAEELGNYIQVSKIAQMFFVLPGIFAAAVFPLTAGGRRRDVNDMLTVMSRSILFFYTLACLFLAVTGKWLFPFIFGTSYDKMYIAFLFIIPGILGLSTLYTLTAYFAGKNRVIVNLKGSLLALVTIACGDVLFIPKYGINAAAAISSLGYIVYHIYVLRVFIKEYKTPVQSFFIFRYSDLLSMKRSVSKNFFN